MSTVIIYTNLFFSSNSHAHFSRYGDTIPHNLLTHIAHCTLQSRHTNCHVVLFFVESEDLEATFPINYFVYCHQSGYPSK